jgi:hypothetical protein
MNTTPIKGKEIKIPGPDHPITISPAEGKLRVIVAGRIVAESTRALQLEEKGYPTAPLTLEALLTDEAQRCAAYLSHISGESLREIVTRQSRNTTT